MTPVRKKSRSSKKYAADSERQPTVNGALCDHVRRSVRRYLKDMGQHDPQELFRMVMNQVEGPLLDEVMKFTDGNQSRASDILGITRNTLRKKISDHHLNK